MKHYLLILLPAALWFGCSTTTCLTPDESSRRQGFISYARFATFGEGKTLTLVLRDGQTCAGKNLAIARDSITFADDSDGRVRSYPVRDISRIEGRDHLAGAVFGFVIGVAGGGALGYGAGQLLSKGDQRGLGSALSTLGGMMWGGILGGVFGGFIGTVHRYEFTGVSTPDTVQANGRR